jgi:hypothetical protein
VPLEEEEKTKNQRPHEDGGRDWNDVPPQTRKVQGPPEAGRSKQRFLNGALGGSAALPTLRFCTSGFHCFKAPGYGNLL